MQLLPQKPNFCLLAQGLSILSITACNRGSPEHHPATGASFWWLNRMLIIMYRKYIFIFYMHLNILRDSGAPKQQKAHVLQITTCSFQISKPPQGFPTPRLPLAS